MHIGPLTVIAYELQILVRSYIFLSLCSCRGRKKPQYQRSVSKLQHPVSNKGQISHKAVLIHYTCSAVLLYYTS